MPTPRSPAYPAISLRNAIDLTKKIHDANRTNPIDREAAAREMGFRGITGSSTKALADIAHFGLIEKAGKGGIRVSQLAVDILYPASEGGKTQALLSAATSPALFGELRAHFSDGLPSEAALKSYLMRQGFITAAVPLVVNSYLETHRFLQGSSVTESHGRLDESAAESKRSEIEPEKRESIAEKRVHPTPSPEASYRSPAREVSVMEGERVIFVDEAGPGQYLKLVASGDLDATLIEALEDFTKRWKKRLGVSGANSESRDGKTLNAGESKAPS